MSIVGWAERVFARVVRSCGAACEVFGARVATLLKLDRRYREDQLRVPGGNTDGGQWTDDGASSSAPGDGRVRVAQAENERDRSALLARFPEATPAQEARWTHGREV
jgi:hypothetical protein